MYRLSSLRVKPAQSQICIHWERLSIIYLQGSDPTPISVSSPKEVRPEISTGEQLYYPEIDGS